MTQQQIKALLDGVLKTLSENIETAARNETDHSASVALNAVAHEVQSARDDLDWIINDVCADIVTPAKGPFEWAGTVSGRFSSKHPTYTEVPRAQIPKVTPLTPLVDVDYAQVEGRVLEYLGMVQSHIDADDLGWGYKMEVVHHPSFLSVTKRTDYSGRVGYVYSTEDVTFFTKRTPETYDETWSIEDVHEASFFDVDNS